MAWLPLALFSVESESRRHSSSSKSAVSIIKVALFISCGLLVVLQFNLLSLAETNWGTTRISSACDQPTSLDPLLGKAVAGELPSLKQKVIDTDIISSNQEKSGEGKQDEEKKYTENKVVTDKFPVDKNEFPYRLDCLEDTKLVVPNGTYSIALAYHVGMVKNWKSIVADQMRTLHACGLDRMVSNTILSYSNGNLGDLLQTLNEHDATHFATPNEIVHSTQVPWEGAAMNSIYGFCQRQVAQKKDKTIVFYFHNKGASKYLPVWRKHLEENRTATYGHSLYWRKYMEYFLLENPQLCINKIVNHGAGTCGAGWGWSPNHYTGNFWAASCDHIITLGTLTLPSGYIDAERWVGQSLGQNTGSNHEYNANLHNNSRGLYKHLITPELYKNISTI